MIVNDAIHPFTAGAENRVPHHGSIVGAGLVPAHDAVLTDDGAIVGALAHDVVPVNTRATTRVAPTLGDVIGARFKPYPEYEDSGIEWLGRIPADWKVRRIRFCASLNPSKREITGLPGATEVSFLPMPKVSETGNLTLDETKPLNEVANGYTYFCNGDVLLAKITPCFENGKAAVAEGLACGVGFGSTEFHVLRPQRSCDARFLYFAVFSDPFRRIGTTHMTGAAGQQRVPEQFVLDWRQMLPGMNHQKAITDFLDRETAKIDALVEKKEQLIELLQEKRIALITHAVTKGLDSNVPLKDSGIEWLGQIPVHWEPVRIKNVADMRAGTAITSEDIDETGEYPVYGGNGLRGYTSSFTHEGEYVLVGRQGALCGNVNYASGTFWASEHAVVATPLGTVNVRWLGEVLRSMRLNELSVAAAQPGLAVDRILSQPIALPPVREQGAIANFLDRETSKIDALIAKVKEAIERLKEYRTALISAAVTGKIERERL